jgi:hypothetical protein
MKLRILRREVNNYDVRRIGINKPENLGRLGEGYDLIGFALETEFQVLVQIRIP